MANEYYTHSSYPAYRSSGSSAALRAELDAIDAGFQKLPVITGNSGLLLQVNNSGSGLEASTVAKNDSGAFVVLTNGSERLRVGTDGSVLIPGQTTIGSAIYSQWTATNTDIDALISGSTFGGLIEGESSGHFTIGLRSNDTGDGFQVISKSAGNATYNKLAFEVKADGTTTVGGSASVSGTLGVTGATTLSSTLGVTGATTLSSTLGVTGAVTAPSVTLTGDLTVGDDIIFTGTTSIIQNSVGTGYVLTSGGSSASLGSNIVLYGESHATLPDTGILRVDTSTIMSWNASGLTFVQPLIIPDGTASAPAIRFSADTDTGIYRVGTNSIGFTTNGTQQAYIADGTAYFAGNMGVGASPANTVNINSSASSTSDQTLTGIQNYSYGTNATLTADRSLYGIYNLAETQVQNAVAFTHNTYGAVNLARTTSTSGNSIDGEGSLYGAYNLAQHQSSDATYTRVESMYGARNQSTLSGTTARSDAVYGSYNLVQTSGAGSSATQAFGVRSNIVASASSTITDSYLFYGDMSNAGTMTNRYGLYIPTSSAYSYTAAGLQVGGTVQTGGSTGWPGLGVGTAPTGSGNIDASGTITATTFSGALSGNASTATTLQTARTINGTSFNGSANITVTAAAGTLTGTSLNATVVSSSLTSVGTLGSLTVSGAAAVGLASTVDGLSIGYRSIPRITTAIAATSNGKCHALTAGLTVPASTFAAGDVVMLYNTGATALTITQGSGLTMRLGGTSTTGNRTLAAYGVASVWFNTATEAVITGSVT